MTADKERLLAELNAERFPHPDVLLAESRQPSPETLRAEQTKWEASVLLAAIQRDDADATARRRNELDMWPSDAQIALRAEARAKRLADAGKVA